jgi:outer membrane protein assembly factor BamD
MEKRMSAIRISSVVRSTILCAALLSISACGGGVGSLFGESKPPIEARSPEDIFADAQSQLAEENHRRAAKMFDEIERLYPYSDLAKKAMLLSAYSSYEGADYDSAITSAQRYIGFYPSDDRTDYARYLVAQSYYEQIVDVGRDQGVTKEALSSLRELIARHPESDYVDDARLKLDTALDQLSGKEMTIGRYYLKRGDYLAAINRFQTVVKQYDTTTHVQEALHRLVEANLALGLVDEAKSAGAVLGHNYPGSDWYSNSYAMLTDSGAVVGAEKDSWYRRAYRQVVKGQWL